MNSFCLYSYCQFSYIFYLKCYTYVFAYTCQQVGGQYPNKNGEMIQGGKYISTENVFHIRVLRWGLHMRIKDKTFFCIEYGLNDINCKKRHYDHRRGMLQLLKLNLLVHRSTKRFVHADDSCVSVSVSVRVYVCNIFLYFISIGFWRLEYFPKIRVDFLNFY